MQSVLDLTRISTVIRVSIDCSGVMKEERGRLSRNCGRLLSQ